MKQKINYVAKTVLFSYQIKIFLKYFQPRSISGDLEFFYSMDKKKKKLITDLFDRANFTELKQYDVCSVKYVIGRIQ